MKKLNIGCGYRYATDWINIDFHSENPEVISCNLLQQLPFANNSLDVIYSSHLLEHFTKEAATGLLAECFRILKPKGILRIVVPDLEQTCREYLRILDTIDNETAKKQYDWIAIELLDQMVRTQKGGLMTGYWKQICENADNSAIQYVEARTGTKVKEEVLTLNKRSLKEKLLRLNPNIIKNKLIYLYVDIVKKLIPDYIRQAMFDNTPLGEKHKWMYDRYSLPTLFTQVGFQDIKLLDAQTSSIPDFNNYYLDIHADGTVYKPGSLYCEGVKSGE